MMDYNGENVNDDSGGEGEESINQNSLSSEEMDPLTEAIDGVLLTLQKALEKEVQQFCGIGNEPIHQEGASEVSSPCSDIETLVNKLEIKLKETRSMLDAKETHIRELESTTNQNRHSWGGTKTTLVEDIFRQRIESEIQYLTYLRSIDNLKNQMKSMEEQERLAEEEAHETLSKLGEGETKPAKLTNRAKDLQKECREINGTIKKRAFKAASCFVIQLVLLLTVVLLFMLMPESDIGVLPT